MKSFFYIIIIFLYCASSCLNKSASDKPKENTVKDSATLKNPGDSSNTFEGANVKSDDYYDNQETPFLNILGCWAAIREGNITISFYPDTSFVFYDYNSKIHEQEELKGKFEINNEQLTLLYNDRRKQKFVFKKDTGDVPKYYIEGASGYYFTRSNCP